MLAEQLKRVNTDQVGDALEGLQREVAFTALEAPHVGAMNSYAFGERLLAITKLLPVLAQIAANHPLKFTFHDEQPRCRAAT